MRNLILSVCSFISFQAVAQVEIVDESNTSVNIAGDTVYVTSNESVVYPHLQVKNTTGATLNLLWKRVHINTTIGFTDQLCDNVLCFDCFGNPWVRPTTIAIAPGANTTFQPKLNTNGVSGTAHHRYYIMDAGEAYIDSIDVIFTSTVGVKENLPLQYSIYPNPANTAIYVKLDCGITNDVYNIKLFNIMGELVRTETITDGNNIVNVSTLTDGIYFYSIIKNNQIVETKKLIIKH